MTRQKKLHIAFDPVYAHPLPEGHRFPMAKYDLIPGQLMYEGTIHSANLFQPLPCRDFDILLTHALIHNALRFRNYDIGLVRFNIVKVMNSFTNDDRTAWCWHHRIANNFKCTVVAPGKHR